MKVRLVFGSKLSGPPLRSKGMTYVMTYPRDPKHPLRCIPGQLISVSEEEAAAMIASGNAMTPTEQELKAYLPQKKAGSEGTGLPGAKVG